jgi:hypothetical protein
MRHRLLKLVFSPAPVVAAMALWAPLPAAAQDDGKGSTEDQLLEKDPAQNQGLEEAKPAEKVDARDPDPKLAEQVETRRHEFEKRLNGMQNLEPHFKKLEGQPEKLVADFLKAQDDFLTKQSGLLSQLHDAAANNDDKGKKKAGDDLIKARKTFMGELDKIGKRADKLQAERDKLMAKYQKEQGEDAKAADKAGKGKAGGESSGGDKAGGDEGGEPGGE